MTHVINLYGGPGCGKSTTAALLYGGLKLAGANAELVREVAKDYAWDGTHITPLIQREITTKQAYLETRLHGKVDFIVTGAPVLLGLFYARKYGGAELVEGIVRAHYADSTAEHLHFNLCRTKPYNPKGRYQTEDEAKAFDGEIHDLVEEVLGVGKLKMCHEIDRFKPSWVMRNIL
jgi:hypothetical protein